MPVPDHYAPPAKPRPVVRPGEFLFAAVGLDHSHIYGQTRGLIEAGATLRWVWDPDPAKVEQFCRQYPLVRVAQSLDEVLQDPQLHLVAAATVPSQRCALGERVMEHGKDYFTDKAPVTTLDQLAQARAAVSRTGRKYAVYFSERVHVECAVHATDLLAAGAIGTVLQVIGLGPHRLGPDRPDWFYDPARSGGILCDIGSQQTDQFLAFSGARKVSVVHARAANLGHPEHPAWEDFGEALLAAEDGLGGYFRVDWFTPPGLSVWGDGRTVILGTEGTMELRKNVDVGRAAKGNHLFLTDGRGEHHLELDGLVGFPYFGKLILDCLNRTETAMTQDHAFRAAELALLAQKAALGR